MKAPRFPLTIRSVTRAVALAAAVAAAASIGAPAAIAQTTPAPALPAEPLFSPYDEVDEVTLAAIDAAQRSVKLAYFNVSLEPALGRLVAAKARGVDVLVVLDAKVAALPYNHLDDLLDAASVRVVRALNARARTASMHQKICVVDGETVITGSGNLSHTGSYSNHESAILVRSAALAAIFEAEIDETLRIEAFVASQLTPQERDDWVTAGTPPAWYVRGDPRQDQLLAGIRALDARTPAHAGPVRVAFAPEERLDRILLQELDAARSEVFVDVFSISMTNLAEKLRDLAARGVRVEVVTDANQFASPSAQQAGAVLTQAAAQHGLRLVVARNENAPYAAMHHKACVIDRSVVAVGAYNWTANATFHSDEALAVVRDAGVAARFYREHALLMARYDAAAFDPARYDAALLASAPAEVTFVARNDRTALGDEVYVVGDRPELGAWDPARAIHLRTGGNCFPSWIASVPLPPGAAFEWKLLVKRADGTVEWEDGVNRAYTLPGDGLNRTIIDDYRQP